MPRKHLIASQTNKKQQLQAKIWLKLAREIKAAAKVGGPNPEANPRLKAAIDKALQNNLSRDSIQRNISGANKDASELTSLTYECYGPNGSQFIIDALTDNQNRTASNLRGYLSKIKGEIAKPNSVKMFFNHYGDFIIPKNNNISADSILEALMNYEIIDIIEQEDCFEVYTDPKCFYEVKKELETKNYQIFSCDIKYIPNDEMTINQPEMLEKIKHFIDSCEDDDDIQSVVTNVVLD